MPDGHPNNVFANKDPATRIDIMTDKFPLFQGAFLS
jgi:hypothetical protein